MFKSLSEQEGHRIGIDAEAQMWCRLESESGLGSAIGYLALECEAMQIASGKVVNGKVVVDGELPEGAEVTLLTLDGEETFEVDAELEAVLLESIAQGERGETVSAAEVLREMRSRE